MFGSQLDLRQSRRRWCNREINWIWGNSSNNSTSQMISDSIPPLWHVISALPPHQNLICIQSPHYSKCVFVCAHFYMCAIIVCKLGVCVYACTPDCIKACVFTEILVNYIFPLSISVTHQMKTTFFLWRLNVMLDVCWKRAHTCNIPLTITLQIHTVWILTSGPRTLSQRLSKA